MNEHEVIEKLKQLKKEGDDAFDHERTHEEGDEVLVEFVRSLGYHRVADTYEEITKWYA